MEKIKNFLKQGAGGNDLTVAVTSVVNAALKNDRLRRELLNLLDGSSEESENSSTDENTSHTNNFSFSSDQLRFIRERPWIATPKDYKFNCFHPKCRQCFFPEDYRDGLAHCPEGHWSPVDPPKEGYIWVYYCTCYHAIQEKISQPGSTKMCPVCKIKLVPSIIKNRVEFNPKPIKISQISTPGSSQQSSNYHNNTSSRIDNWKDNPAEYEVECFWGCSRPFTLNIAESYDYTRCPVCQKCTPLRRPDPGHSWIYFNDCAHLEYVETNNYPNSCKTCGGTSGKDIANVVTPIKKKIG